MPEADEPQFEIIETADQARERDAKTQADEDEEED